jgi:hypothetical protein
VPRRSKCREKNCASPAFRFAVAGQNAGGAFGFHNSVTRRRENDSALHACSSRSIKPETKFCSDESNWAGEGQGQRMAASNACASLPFARFGRA